MKKIFLLLTIVAATAMSSCDNESFDGCVQVKLINELCGTAILQVVGGDVPEGIANSWTDNEGNTYQNVFTTFLDPCLNYPTNTDSFFVKIVAERVPSDCIVCMALLADAPEEYFHTVVSNECETDSNDF